METFDNRGQTGQEVVFASDGDPSATPCVSLATNGCTMVENGQVQTIPFLITWSDGGSDTIEFQSAVDEFPAQTPEPATALLVAVGALALRKRR